MEIEKVYKCLLDGEIFLDKFYYNFKIGKGILNKESWGCKVYYKIYSIILRKYLYRIY